MFTLKWVMQHAIHSVREVCLPSSVVVDWNGIQLPIWRMLDKHHARGLNGTANAFPSSPGDLMTQPDVREGRPKGKKV